MQQCNIQAADLQTITCSDNKFHKIRNIIALSQSINSHLFVENYLHFRIRYETSSGFLSEPAKSILHLHALFLQCFILMSISILLLTLPNCDVLSSYLTPPCTFFQRSLVQFCPIFCFVFRISSFTDRQFIQLNIYSHVSTRFCIL